MTKFLKRHKLSKLKQEIENIHITEIKSMFCNFPTKQIPVPDSFTDEYQSLRDKMVPSSYRFWANQNWKSGLV